VWFAVPSSGGRQWFVTTHRESSAAGPGPQRKLSTWFHSDGAIVRAPEELAERDSIDRHERHAPQESGSRAGR